MANDTLQFLMFQRILCFMALAFVLLLCGLGIKKYNRPTTIIRRYHGGNNNSITTIVTKDIASSIILNNDTTMFEYHDDDDDNSVQIEWKVQNDDSIINIMNHNATDDHNHHFFMIDHHQETDHQHHDSRNDAEINAVSPVGAGGTTTNLLKQLQVTVVNRRELTTTNSSCITNEFDLNNAVMLSKKFTLGTNDPTFITLCASSIINITKSINLSGYYMVFNCSVLPIIKERNVTNHCILDGLLSSRIFYGMNMNVTFQNITFQNSKATMKRATNQSKNTIIDQGYGGVFDIRYNSIININDCIFRNNKAIKGGAIYIKYGSKLIITNTIFDTNYAHQHGGAILISSLIQSSYMKNVTFQNNIATTSMVSSILYSKIK